MALQVEGLAIVSDDGMLADGRGIMPDALKIEADQRFLSERLDAAALIVHGRNSHEGHPQSPARLRLVATRGVRGLAPADGMPKAMLWNPADLDVESAAALLGISEGSVAVLGGTALYGLFLPRYDTFHLSRASGIELPAGRPVFPGVPLATPEAVLRGAGLCETARTTLDRARGATLSTFTRPARGECGSAAPI
jgi:dihydrofolate reductase